jgi:hypothetical protein
MRGAVEQGEAELNRALDRLAEIWLLGRRLGRGSLSGLRSFYERRTLWAIPLN